MRRSHGDPLEVAATVAPGRESMLEVNVLRSPGREEYTCIAFYCDRGYRDHIHGRRHIESLVTLDTSYSSTAPDARSRAPETARMRLAPDEPLELRVFVDRSVVEAFVNGRQCVAARVYPERGDSTGVSFRSQGTDSHLTRLDVWEMQSIHSPGTERRRHSSRCRRTAKRRPCVGEINHFNFNPDHPDHPAVPPVCAIIRRSHRISDATPAPEPRAFHPRRH